MRRGLPKTLRYFSILLCSSQKRTVRSAKFPENSLHVSHGQSFSVSSSMLCLIGRLQINSTVAGLRPADLHGIRMRSERTSLPIAVGHHVGRRTVVENAGDAATSSNRLFRRTGDRSVVEFVQSLIRLTSFRPG